MRTNFVLIDYENVQPTDLAQLREAVVAHLAKLKAAKPRAEKTLLSGAARRLTSYR